MKPYLKLLRPKQWTKNLLVFAALLFTHGYSDPLAIKRSLMAFVVMCLISSAAYIVNDLRDAERDRAHPAKRFRPIAAGQVKPPAAVGIAIALAVIALLIMLLLGKKVLVLAGIYLLLQLLYNLTGKQVAVLDVFLIASGFVLRAVLGAAAINVNISAWLLLCTGSLALLLGFGKRRHEFILQGEKRSESRSSLLGYNKQRLDALVVMTATASALCYAIYALESPTAVKYPALVLTNLFVFYGICRYVLLIFVFDEGGEPEQILLRDPHIILSLLLFVVAAMFALSGIRLPLLEYGPGGIQ